MKTLSRTNLLAAAALAAVTFTAPAIAHASDYGYNNSYEDCKKSDTEAQIIGGLLGALAGGVLGSNVAGHGDQDAGTAIGAVAGAAAGVAIGNKDCAKRNGVYTGSTYNNGYTTSQPVYTQTVAYHPSVNSRSGNYSYSNNRGYNNRNIRSYQGYYSEQQVRADIERLKREADQLRRQNNRGANGYQIAQRLYVIKAEIKRLKKVEDYFQ